MTIRTCSRRSDCLCWALFGTNDLPDASTANKRVLTASRGFAARAVIVPDYVIPNGFLATDGGTAVLVSRSGDGGLTWSIPSVLIADGSTFFNDKESITADPYDARKSPAHR